MKIVFHSIFVLVFLLINVGVFAQNTKLSKGTVIHLTVHGKSLEGNLDNDSPDRPVTIYLPASYAINPDRHYPVVYFLHGFTDNDSKWYGLTHHWINMTAILDTLFTSGTVKDMIFVTPDADTRFRGSMYSNSVTTGNWEDFVAKELVAYIDSHYRTIPKASSRGLAGHSMGGYGTLRIGERNPDVFSSIYLLSPASLAPINTAFIPQSLLDKIEDVKTIDDFNKADFAVKYSFASSAAWSSDANNPPLYLDAPVKNGKIVPEVMAKWAANAPLTTLDEYIDNLKKLNAIGFDAGDKDIDIAGNIRTLDRRLNGYGIKHSFEIYHGTHTDHIAQRMGLKVVAFFSNNLMFE